MTDVVWRAIGTVVAAVVHIGLLLGVISISSTPTANEKNQQSSDFLVNTALGIVVLSFFTVLFHIWELFDTTLAGQLYFSYIILLFSAIHAEVLLDLSSVYDGVKKYVYINLWFIAVLAALFIVAIFSGAALELLGGFYGRLIVAVAIIDFTFSIAIAVVQHLYVQKHPELRVQTQTQHLVGRMIVALLLLVFLGWPILTFFLSFFLY